MDYSKLTLEDITKNPKLLEDLKSLAASGSQLQRIGEQHKNEFLAATFFDPADAEVAFSRLKVKPILRDDFTLGFENNIGRIISTESVLQMIEDEGVGHYLKPKQETNNLKAEAPKTKTVENPWVTGNRTQQLLILQRDQERAAQLKKLAAK